MIIVLDNIRSAWNVGSIFRTCDALGAQLILIGYTPRPLGATLNLIKKTAIGAEHTVEWRYFETAREALETYSQGLHYAVEITETSKNMFKYFQEMNSEDQQKHLEKEVFLWFGNEIRGIQPELFPDFDHILHLPMKGMKESLNIANCVCAAGYIVQYFTEELFPKTFKQSK